MDEEACSSIFSPSEADHRYMLRSKDQQDFFLYRAGSHLREGQIPTSLNSENYHPRFVSALKRAHQEPAIELETLLSIPAVMVVKPAHLPVQL